MSSDLAQELSQQTRELVARFESRANSFAGRVDLAKFAIPVDSPSAERLARDFLGEGELTATGIDGSMDFDERLQMMLFYANATAYSCPFTVGGRITFDLAQARRDSRMAASAAIPLWTEDLGSVMVDQPEIDIELEHSMERIPNSFMTLAELYLANLACERSKIIFLDRPMSGTFTSLSRDARLLLRRGGTNLLKWSKDSPVSPLDLYLSLQLGPPSAMIPGRDRYLRLAIVRELTSGPKKVSELAESLRVKESKIFKALKLLSGLGERYGGVMVAEVAAGEFGLAEGVGKFWERSCNLALGYSEAVFENRRHPLAVDKEEYLNILDVNSLSLILLWRLVQRAREMGVLLVGIAKDTTATDLARSVLPYAIENRLISVVSPPPKLKNDRAFLAILSAENPFILTPWRTPGYDSAYSTIVKVGQKFVSARKNVSRERLFVRSFFQLRTLRSDESVRSQVFLFDRPFDERYDQTSVRSFEVTERSGPVTIDAYFEGNDGSSLSNLVLHILSMNDNPEVFEAFGHNQLLYLADKAVKAEVGMLRSSLRGVADISAGRVSSRKRIFGLVTTYREQRSDSEHTRKRAGRR